ncbi:DNA topoisomerase II [Mimivirus AB-566-O17]|uniref:DNA topoisomerase 2 n=1 Tax=Mimivirus AB-566-O17 TaxID=1988039 RepID=A0A1X9VNR0_9VIRU|nr:DNA topoisomerase II [Mimivirus AB-566-O17]
MTTIEQKYQKLTDREHILKRPDTYIGEVKKNINEVFTFNPDTNKIEKQNVEYSAGFLKMFDEILTNAIDFSLEEPTVTQIKVNIDQETGELSVFNNGPGIPIVEHAEHKIYIPEMIFGHLRTGSNYDDNKLRAGGGRNGLGGKVTNIFSSQFTIETVNDGKKYIQTFSENNSKKTKPKITKNKTSSYTKISWIPDFKRFGMKGIENDIMNLLHKRTLDSIVSTPKNVGLFFNGQKITGKSLKEYVKYYFDDLGKVFYETQTFTKRSKNSQVDLVWELAVVENPEYESVSFVNGICTTLGGTHTNYITHKLVSKLKIAIETKLKKDIKPAVIKERLMVFLRATIVNPTFKSQTKEELSTPLKDDNLFFEISDTLVKKIMNGTEILESIKDYTLAKETVELKKKTDGSKKKRVFIPKLEDANLAGTQQSHKCSLLLTEGDSGKTFAMRARPNPEYYGIFPLRGKLINIRDASVKQLLENEELNNLKQILGLEQGKVYTDTKQLRYGHVCLLTDSDVDGTHIRSLFVNILHYWWPSLLKLDFVSYLRTPIVKIKVGNQSKEFFTEQDFESWQRINKRPFKSHYYKGLGTSTKDDAKNIQKRFTDLSLGYKLKDSGCDDAIKLAFEKDNKKGQLVKWSDQRKEWLKKYDRNIFIDSKSHNISYKDLINKELVHFSVYDNVRSIPNITDGLKPSQRKIIHYLLKKNPDLIKVAQLAGYVSAETAYHHGEVSLQQAIICLAQDFVGSNNMNILTPEGNMGSRLGGGKDAASPRYIFTCLSNNGKTLFDKRDSDILKYLTDDNKQIEPEYFVPILPTVLVNGCEGIGTGYSTFIPSFNPKDIIQNLKALLVADSNETEPEIKRLVPWYKNFKGTVTADPIKPGVYTVQGLYSFINKTTIKITELPVGVWITDYIEFLKSLCDGYKTAKNEPNKNLKHTLCGLLKDVQNRTRDENNDIEIIVEFFNADDTEHIIKDLKLSKNVQTNNMHLFDSDFVIQKYNTPEDILLEYYDTRIEMYQTRKEYIITVLQDKIQVLDNKIRFINGYLDNTIKIARVQEEDIITQLDTMKFLKINNTFEYLLTLPIRTLSKTKIDKLTHELATHKKDLGIISKKSKYTLWLDDLEQLEIE